METTSMRREESNRWITKFTPFKEEMIQREVSSAHSLQVLLSQVVGDGNLMAFLADVLLFSLMVLVGILHI